MSFHQYDNYLSGTLQKRMQDGLLRRLTNGEGLADFCSNDYLGLARELSLVLRENESGADVGLCGSTGSRLVSGNSLEAEDTERLIAAYHGAEAALFFNTGYMANTGLCSCIGDKDSTFIYDELIHASVHDGMRLSLAKRYKFRHNDVDDLAKKLGTVGGRKYVLIESLYSMDGDLAPLPEIAAVCKEHGAALIVDEAHATGIFGEGGRGLVCRHGLEALVWARIHTFGKALGLHGAAVLGSDLLRIFLINHARSFIYTTAPPPILYAQVRQAYRLLADNTRRQQLFDVIDHFNKDAAVLSGMEFLRNPSPIQAILVPGNERALSLAAFLREQGFFVKAILSPTVPAGTERIRICLHSFNTFEQVDHLLAAVKQFFS